MGSHKRSKIIFMVCLPITVENAIHSFSLQVIYHFEDLNRGLFGMLMSTFTSTTALTWRALASIIRKLWCYVLCVCGNFRHIEELREKECMFIGKPEQPSRKTHQRELDASWKHTGPSMNLAWLWKLQLKCGPPL